MKIRSSRMFSNDQPQEGFPARDSHVCLQPSMTEEETARSHGRRRRCCMISTRRALTQLMGSGLAVTMLVAMTACGGPPTWVKKGSGPYNDKDARVFYGVGSILGIKNEPLAWDAAENRARAELAKNFETYTAYLMRDYAASTSAGDFTRSTEEQNVERAIKTFTAVTLNGVRPVDRYKDDKTGTYYVLAKMSLKDMQDAIEQSKELNSQVRDFVRKNSERLFDRLEKEEQQRAPNKQ